jgi:hypothetical protein
MQRAAGQRRHDLRTGYVPAYVDTERTRMNSVVVPPKMESEARQICEERRGQKKRKMRKNAAVLTCGIVTFGREAQQVISSLPREEQDRLFLEAVSRVAAYLRTDVESLVVHRDESAIHAHFRMYAYSRDGRPLSKVISKEAASRLQDIVGEVYSRYGIHRGERKEVRIARGDDMRKVIHRSVRQLHEDLPREVEELAEKARKAEELIRAKIEEQRAKIQKNEDLIRRQEMKLREGKVEEEKARKRIETYQRRADEARREVEELERELAARKQALAKAKEEYRFPLPPRTVRVKCVTEEGLLRPKIEEREFFRVDDVKRIYTEAHRAFASLHERYERMRVERDMYRRISCRQERELEAFIRDRGREECDLFERF